MYARPVEPIGRRDRKKLQTRAALVDAALRLAVRALQQAGAPDENGRRLEVAVLERDRARRSFRRLTQEDVASRTAEPAP